MTDIFTGALAAFSGPELVIQYPIEAETGGDLDLRFWHVKSGRSLYLRVQAKRLNAAQTGTKEVKISNRSYHELLHKPPKASDYQFQTLVNAPTPWVPLYMFYNHQSVASDAYFSGSGPTVSGVNLAFATDVAVELTSKLIAAKNIPKSIKHHKRLSHLRKHFFGLEAILCPHGSWAGASVPTPDLVATSLSEQWNKQGERSSRKDDEAIVMRKLSEPDQLLSSETGERIPDGPAIRINQNLKRPLISFISGRTDDDRTPSIGPSIEVLQ
ncbi:hypothetical protein G0A00_10075 [Yangia sp. PrR002]|nr:DUF6615 family protein [Salipiger sp. PrR002]NDV99639.1 hypothetical protein [Salipiger sp. PrR002]NDW56763.1 hypothetical protein [Salipiger sp. PrR004]